ncbi:hypothetical protein D3C80_1562630 [compost metagenome]
MFGPFSATYQVTSYLPTNEAFLAASSVTGTGKYPNFKSGLAVAIVGASHEPSASIATLPVAKIAGAEA